MDIKHAVYMSQCPQLQRDSAALSRLADKENCSGNGFNKSNLYRQLEEATPQQTAPADDGVKQRLKSPPAFDSSLFQSAASQAQQNRDITIIKNFMTTPPSEIMQPRSRPQPSKSLDHSKSSKNLPKKKRACGQLQARAKSADLVRKPQPPRTLQQQHFRFIRPKSTQLTRQASSDQVQPQQVATAKEVQELKEELHLQRLRNADQR